MLGYVTIGYNDADAALKFYDAVFGALGLKRDFFEGGWAGYSKAGTDQSVFLCKPFDGQEARSANGTMIAFKGENAEQVHAAYEAGLASGGSDEGKPGRRPEDSNTFYGAYLRDPTGNKFAIYCKP